MEEQIKSYGINKKKGKLEASEEKRFWRQSAPEVLTSSEAPHQKQDHQRQFSSEDHQELKIIRSWENWSFKRCSNDLISPIIAEDLKIEATANSNGFEGIGCFFFGESWKRTIVRSVQPPSPLLCLCLQQHKNNSYACTNVPSDLEWIWNWSFIGQ